jgi:broad specificity phosphatase PhoE
MRTTIHFVRHAEALSNIGINTSELENVLTEQGESQIKSIIEKLSSIRIRKIFSSNVLRAKLTSFGIKEGINKDVDIIDNIYERSNSESYVTFLERIKDTGKFIEDLPEGHYIVVSHAIFIKNLISQLLLDELFTNDISINITNRVIIENASISTCIYNQDKKVWRLESTNK